MNPVFTTRMKRAVLATLISLSFVSQSFAVLRPLFPIKPVAPSNGELIAIGDVLVLRSAKNPRLHHRVQAHEPLPGPPSIAFVISASPAVHTLARQPESL